MSGVVAWLLFRQARKQQVAVLDSETGKVQEVELSHHGEGVEQSYAALPRRVTVAVESTGYALWFHALMRKLGHTRLGCCRSARRSEKEGHVARFPGRSTSNCGTARRWVDSDGCCTPR